MAEATPDGSFTCPVPVGRYDHVVLGHGSGGRLSHELLTGVFLPAFANPVLSALEDQAVVDVDPLLLAGGRLAFTTDAFVVRPLFFPGGDVGTLSVCGTVNDLAVGGALPRWLSASFILEEGFAIADLRRVVASMRASCAEVGVPVVCGDTKVVERGKGDGCFITTSGVGVVPRGVSLGLRHARPGDVVLVSGTIGDHGLAVLSVREGLAFETDLVSDCAHLLPLCQLLVGGVPGLRCLRDATRGGVTSVLHELAAAGDGGRGVAVVVDEASVPVKAAVRGACEMLGLDPLYVANEGKLVAVVAPDDAARALSLLRGHALGKDAAIIGTVVERTTALGSGVGAVTVRSGIGGERLLSLLSGEQLPRIC